MDLSLKHRVNAGKTAVENQIDFFKDQFAQVESQWKADKSRVTFVDFAISERVFEELQLSFPDDDYCSEEANPEDSSKALNARYAWVLDPVDGTNNYATGIALCSISLALLKDGMPVYGFIYDYSTDKLIHGGPETGLYDGKKKLQFEQKEMDINSNVSINFPIPDNKLKTFQKLMTDYKMRCPGSTAIALVWIATGQISGIVDTRSKIWDLAAGHALIEATGQKIHFFQDACFPLKEFHVSLPACNYYAGSDAFCKEIELLLNA